MKLSNLLTEISYTPKAQKFLDAIQLQDRNIKDLKNITVDATPQGNWSVYYKGKRLGTINGKLLDDATIMKYGLEHYNESVNEGNWSKIMAGVKKGSQSGPWSLVIIKNKKVIHQQNISVRNAIPAHYESAKKFSDFKGSILAIEDGSGQIVYSERI